MLGNTTSAAMPSAFMCSTRVSLSQLYGERNDEIPSFTLGSSAQLTSSSIFPHASSWYDAAHASNSSWNCCARYGL